MLRDAFLSLSNSKLLGNFMTGSRVAWYGAHRFVAGQTIDATIGTVRELNQAGLRASLDYLGENVSTRAEADQTRAAYIEALDRIQATGVHSGVSLKLTALGLDLDVDLAEANLRQVVEHAARLSPARFVRVDMEGSAYTERTIELFARVRAEHANVGIVVQSYLYRTAGDVERLIALGAGVRLCKGAYLEPESVAYPAKADVDAAYLRLAERLLSPEARARGVYPALATHDPQIIDWAKRHVARHAIPREAFEFQMLYGIRRDLQAELAREGYRMRVYVPYGSQWYPYFMRRLAERPENVAFIARSVWQEVRPWGR
jgi:proline dehydrogenase